MVISEKKTKKVCSFYISDFHLEMIIVPDINKKLEKNEEIQIVTEKNLEKSIEILLNRMNISEKSKNNIYNLNWQNKNLETVKDKSNIYVIGSEKFINNIDEKLQNKRVTIINCYDFNEVKENINNIVNEHDKTLNTLGKFE